jgi:hypothetical protein
VSLMGVWEVRENCTGNEESKPEERAGEVGVGRRRRAGKSAKRLGELEPGRYKLLIENNLRSCAHVPKGC